jgi:hypothetical protein
MCNSHLFSDFGSPTLKSNGGPSPGFTDYLDLKPAHAVADSSSESFGGGLLGRKTRRQAFGGVSLSEAIRLFGRREDPVQKARSKALHRLTNALNLH